MSSILQISSFQQGIEIDRENSLKNLLDEHHICEKEEKRCERLFAKSNGKTAQPLTFEKILVNMTPKSMRGKTLPFYYSHSGRLGNIMYQYAAMYELSKFYDRELIIDSDMMSELRQAFVMNSTWFKKQRFFDSESHVPRQKDIRRPLHVVKLNAFTLPSHLTPFSFFGNYLAFDHDMKEISRLYTFRPEIIANASKQLNNITSKLQNKSSLTLIGIHVRRSDMVHYLHLATKEYFVKAFRYFKEKYHKAHFIATSEDTEKQWIKENLSPLGNVSILPNGNAPATDMAALTLCDHMIISVGSFGFWAGYLNKGEVIFYNGNNQAKYFPPNWIAMTE